MSSESFKKSEKKLLVPSPDGDGLLLYNRPMILPHWPKGYRYVRYRNMSESRPEAIRAPLVFGTVANVDHVPQPLILL